MADEIDQTVATIDVTPPTVDPFVEASIAMTIMVNKWKSLLSDVKAMLNDTTMSADDKVSGIVERVDIALGSLNTVQVVGLADLADSLKPAPTDGMPPASTGSLQAVVEVAATPIPTVTEDPSGVDTSPHVGPPDKENALTDVASTQPENTGTVAESTPTQQDPPADQTAQISTETP